MAAEQSIHHSTRGRPRRRGKRKVLLGLLALCALPVLAAVFVLLQPEEKKQALLERIPEGAAGWLVAAIVAFATMAILAWVVLPLLHHGSGWLRGRWLRLTDKPLPVRILLSPVQALLEAAWLALQALFAVDAFLIILAALLGLLFTIRILDPGILPDIARSIG